MSDSSSCVKRLSDLLGQACSVNWPSCGPSVLATIVASLKDLILEIVERDRLLVAVAERSYEHPNGFDKVILIDESSTGFKLRLNVWWPGCRRDGSEYGHIHNHRWSFCSHILCGGFSWREYKLEQGGEQLFAYAYRPIDEEGRFELRYLGRESARPGFWKSAAIGDNYWMHEKLFHEVRVDEHTLVATAVIQGPPQRASTMVLSRTELDQLSLGRVRVQRISPSELRTRLERVLASVHGDSFH